MAQLFPGGGTGTGGGGSTLADLGVDDDANSALDLDAGGLNQDLSTAEGSPYFDSGTIVFIKDNLSATIAPTTANDNTQGYSIGSKWLTATEAYICQNASTGAANWILLNDGNTGGSGGGTGGTIESARIQLDAPQLINDNSPTIINFDNEVYDDGTYIDLVADNTRITVPSDDDYLFIVYAQFDFAASGFRQARLFKNGTDNLEPQRIEALSGTLAAFTAAFSARLQANDYVQLQVYQNSGGSLNFSSATPGLQAYVVVYRLAATGGTGGSSDLIILDSTKQIHISPTGVAGNDGSLGSPLPPQEAIDLAASIFQAGFPIEILCLDGTYNLTAPLVFKDALGSGDMTFKSLNNDRSLVIFDGGASIARIMGNSTESNKWIIRDVTMQNTTDVIVRMTSEGESNKFRFIDCDFNSPAATKEVMYNTGPNCYIRLSGTINCDLTGLSLRAAFRVQAPFSAIDGNLCTINILGNPTFTSGAFEAERNSYAQIITGALNGPYTGNAAFAKTGSTVNFSGGTTFVGSVIADIYSTNIT